MECSRFYWEVATKPSAAVLSVLLALALLAIPFFAHAQQPGTVYRIGYLGGSPEGYQLDATNCPKTGSPSWQAILAGLRERGYIPAQNLVIECRWTESREERARVFAAELVNLKPDLLLVFSTANVRAAKQAASTIPIVMYGVIDPAGRGLVASLARPGGNVTGTSDDTGREIAGKQLQLLTEAVPEASRVAVFGYQSGENVGGKEREDAARALKLTLQGYGVREPEQLEGAFAAMTRARMDAILADASPFMSMHRKQIVELAAKHRLPAMYPTRDMVDAGGLMAYTVDQLAMRRRVGVYVDKIFKGERPGEIPVEQPTKFLFIINLKTAKALGLTIPPSLLMLAEEVIQ